MDDLGVPKNVKIIADSARPEMIKDLNEAGYWVEACKKYKGSVVDGITRLQAFDIELNDSPNATKEIQNYFWKNKKGQILDEPEDGFDHGMDAIRYGSEYYSEPIINVNMGLPQNFTI